MPDPAAASSSTADLIARQLPGGALALRASYHHQRFSRHIHEDYALGVIESGALGFRYRGSQVVAPTGSLSLAQPDVPHDGGPAVPEGWCYSMLYLPRAILASVLPENSPTPYFRPGVIADTDLAARLRLTHQLLLDPAASRLAQETRLLTLVALWIRRHADDHPAPPAIGPEPGAVKRVLDILAACFADPISLGDLAQAVGLSPWHIARAVTRHTGLPPHAHLLGHRLRAAKSLLAGPKRLADIAAAVGFADQSHLTRAFRACFGLTPGAYRKIVQNTGSNSS